MKTSALLKERDHCIWSVAGAALAVCACMQSVPAWAGPKLGGMDLWITTDAAASSPALNGPSLLRPPASWSWDAAAPTLDFAAGIGHRFAGGLNLDAGISVAHVSEFGAADALYEETSTREINYRDYFLGMSFGALDGKIWYLPEHEHLGGQPSAMYYEAGWAQSVGEKLSLSVRLGHYDGGATNRLLGSSDAPSLSLGASTTLSGYGLGLRLIDGGGQMFGGDQNLQLMGSISKPLR